MLEWVYALGIPLVILVVAALGKKLVRGTPFEVEDWFLGVNASLTAITTGLASIAKFLSADPKKVSLCLVVAFFAYVLTLVIHQEHERRPRRPYKASSKFYLGIVSNFIGFGALAAVLLLLR